MKQNERNKMPFLNGSGVFHEEQHSFSAVCAVGKRIREKSYCTGLLGLRDRDETLCCSKKTAFNCYKYVCMEQEEGKTCFFSVKHPSSSFPVKKTLLELKQYKEFFGFGFLVSCPVFVYYNNLSCFVLNLPS